jgi:hypothetical protein
LLKHESQLGEVKALESKMGNLRAFWINLPERLYVCCFTALIQPCGVSQVIFSSDGNTGYQLHVIDSIGKNGIVDQ